MDVEKVMIFDRFWNPTSTHFQTSSTCKIRFSPGRAAFFSIIVSRSWNPEKHALENGLGTPFWSLKCRPNRFCRLQDGLWKTCNFSTQAHTHFCSENIPRRMKDLAFTALIFDQFWPLVSQHLATGLWYPKMSRFCIENDPNLTPKHIEIRI